MADLPRPALATASHPIGDASVELRALTFSEARKLRDITDEGARVAWMVACAVGISEQDADEWIGALSVGDGADLILAIVALSGLEETVEVKVDGADPKASHAKKPMSAS